MVVSSAQKTYNIKNFDAAKIITVRNCSLQWRNNISNYFAHVIKSKKADSLQLFNVLRQAVFSEGLEAVKK